MSTIEVGGILSTRNEVNGVKVFHDYYNCSEKEIKYITFTYVPYNPVDDAVEKAANGKLTGPIPPKHKSYVTWENMWYNATVTKVVLTQILVQFMDGSEELIQGEDVVSMEDEKSAYYRDFTRVKKAESELAGICDMDSAEKICSSVFAKFDDDKNALMKMLRGLKANINSGYFIGDYIEKNNASDEELVKVAVEIWKSTIAWQRKAYNTPAAITHSDFPEKYAPKIQKYEPDYVLPKEEKSFIGGLIGKIMSFVVKK